MQPTSFLGLSGALPTVETASAADTAVLSTVQGAATAAKPVKAQAQTNLQRWSDARETALPTFGSAAIEQAEAFRGFAREAVQDTADAGAVKNTVEIFATRKDVNDLRRKLRYEDLEDTRVQMLRMSVGLPPVAPPSDDPLHPDGVKEVKPAGISDSFGVELKVKILPGYRVRA